MTEPAILPMRRRLMLAALGSGLPVAAPAALPSFEWPPIPLLDGSILQPTDWRDTAAVVVFWSTTCPFCRRHNEHVDKLHRANSGRPLRVLGVATDADANLVRRYLAERRHTFPVTMEAARLRPLFTTRNVIPMTCTVDRSGHRVATVPGEMFEEDVMEFSRLADRPARA